MSYNSEHLLAEIEQQLNRAIFFSMTTGRFPESWSTEIYNKNMRDRNRVMRLYAVCFGDAQEDDTQRQRISESIEREFPNICSKVYSNRVMCLSFEQKDLQEDVAKKLTAVLDEVLDCTCQCYSSGRVEDLEQLIPAYRALRKEVDASRKGAARSRDSQIVSLYAQENELFDQIVEADIDGIEVLLGKLAMEVEDAHRIYVSNDEDLLICIKNYFSYLWRRIARVVYERTSKRKTIQQYVTMDLEMVTLSTRDEVVELVLDFIRLLSEELNLADQGSFHKIIENVKKYIDDNYASNVSLNYVADQVGLSSYYLSKLFKKEENMNYKEYVIKVRMEKAMLLINEGKLNVNEIACAVGYDNANYFSQAFHRYYGMPPKACQTRGVRGSKQQ